VIARGEEPSRIRVNTVRFSPRARTAWHAHAVGQTLHVTEGRGLVQTRGGELVEIRIDPRAIDPDDPELLADMVLAAANEALRTAQSNVEAKIRAQMPDLGALGLPGF